jgi:hypothetical protein
MQAREQSLTQIPTHAHKSCQRFSFCVLLAPCWHRCQRRNDLPKHSRWRKKANSHRRSSNSGHSPDTRRSGKAWNILGLAYEDWQNLRSHNTPMKSRCAFCRACRKKFRTMRWRWTILANSTWPPSSLRPRTRCRRSLVYTRRSETMEAWHGHPATCRDCVQRGEGGQR